MCVLLLICDSCNFWEWQNTFIDLSMYLNRVLKPCTDLGTDLWKRASKGSGWWCFVLLLGAILSIALQLPVPLVTARISRPCAWESLQVARLARDDCVWQNVCVGLVLKAKHVQCYQVLLETWDLAGASRRLWSRGWWFWSDSQLDSDFKVFSLRSDKSGGYLKQALREFKTDELRRFGLEVFFDSRLLRRVWGWLNLEASLICVSTTY